MSRENLVVALVGYGYWGPNLLRNYMELPGVTVKWVCDRDANKLAKAKMRYPVVTVTAEYSDVLNDAEVDAVLVATPISTHFPLALRAIEAGKHVFVEKPMTASELEARALVAAAEARGVTLMVGHTFEFSSPVVAIKSLIDSGEIGDVYYVSSSRINLGLHQKDVSVIWDLAPHDFSILFDWLCEEPEHVSAVGRGCVKCDIPDVAFVTLRFPGGAVAEVQLSWLSPVKLRRTLVVGSKKMLVYDDTESVEKVKLYDHGVNIMDPGSFGEFQMSYRTGDIVSRTGMSSACTRRRCSPRSRDLRAPHVPTPVRDLSRVPRSRRGRTACCQRHPTHTRPIRASFSARARSPRPRAFWARCRVDASRVSAS